MSPAIFGLPPELLDRIFCFLSANKVTIGSCRLVSSAFKEVSSPHLITRVVFAHRYGAITRMLAIVNHPCFHRYVTELVYDASEYGDRVAESRSGYTRLCVEAPRIFKDDERSRRRATDRATLSAIDQGIKRLQDSRHTEVGEDGKFVSIDERDVRTADGEESETEDHIDQAHRLGCHKSFSDYRELFRNQTQIQRRKLSQRMLTLALSKLPALRSVVLTDWRGLVRQGESYDSCARRLFGNTLAPELKDQDYEVDPSAFNNILFAYTQVLHATIESFAVGPHAFEHPSMPRENGPHGVKDKRDAQHVSQLTLRHANISHGKCMFPKLRRLYLPVSIHLAVLQYASMEPLYPPRLFEITQGLTHLYLPLEELPTSMMLEVNPKSTDLFEPFLSDSHFPQLQLLDLRRWSVSHELFTSFLKRHSATLRQLRLLGCVLHGDPLVLANWASTSLHLQGIELDATDCTRCPSYVEIETWGRRRWKLHPEMAPLTDERETLWLGGRRNSIEYLQSKPPMDNSGDMPWYCKPINS